MLAALLLMQFIPIPSTTAQQADIYYESTQLNYTINGNRSVDVQLSFTLTNNSSSRRVQWVSLPVSTAEVYNVQVSSNVILDEIENTGTATTIRVRFKGSGLGPGSRITYSISFKADGLVTGSGVEYSANLGGVNVGGGGFPHENYVVTIRGPSGSRLFLPKPSADLALIENDPPTIRYFTSIGAPGSFDGLQVRFYLQPVYYKLTLTERLTNEDIGQINNVQLDVMLFSGEAGWQFSALESSSRPIKTMYVDEENNWHGVFDLGKIPPSGMKTLQLKLIYETSVYDPEISEGEVGSLADVPDGFSPYLQPDDEWESDHPAIKQAASEAVGGETNAYLVGQKIVKFIVDRLSYQTQETRRGALWAYVNGIGDCSEYTDLSIALARAAGLPARAVYGWGYQEDNLSGHAWAEFYLPGKGWQPVDPTWAERSGDYFARLDPIHLTRDIRGLSSSESGLVIAYHGPAPRSQEDGDLLVLTASGAAQGYIDAAARAIEVADGLLASNPSEDLNQSLQLAQQKLEQAQATGDEIRRLFVPLANPQRKVDFSSIGRGFYRS